MLSAVALPIGQSSLEKWSGALFPFQVLPSRVGSRSYPASIKLGWKGLQGTNTSLFCASISFEKSFVNIVLSFLNIFFQGGWQGRPEVLHRPELLLRVVATRDGQGHRKNVARQSQKGRKTI